MAEPITTLQYFSFEIGGYTHDNRKIIIKNNSYELMKSMYSYAENLLIPDSQIVEQDESELIKVLNDIALTSWKKNFYNNNILDGTQWEIEIKYNNQIRLKKYYGSNEFPFVDIKTNTISSKILDERPDFIKLHKVLNKLIKKKNFFSV